MSLLDYFGFRIGDFGLYMFHNPQSKIRNPQYYFNPQSKIRNPQFNITLL